MCCAPHVGNTGRVGGNGCSAVGESLGEREACGFEGLPESLLTAPSSPAVRARCARCRPHRRSGMPRASANGSGSGICVGANGRSAAGCAGGGMSTPRVTPCGSRRHANARLGTVRFPCIRRATGDVHRRGDSGTAPAIRDCRAAAGAVGGRITVRRRKQAAGGIPGKRGNPQHPLRRQRDPLPRPDQRICGAVGDACRVGRSG